MIWQSQRAPARTWETPPGDMMLDRDGDLLVQLLLYLSLVLIVASLMGLSAVGIAAWSSE